MKQLLLVILVLLSGSTILLGADVSATATPTSSPYVSDGSIDLTIRGGFAPYEISWTGPSGFASNQEDISELESGNYVVVIRDALCGEATIEITVGETACPSPLIASSSIVRNPCFGQDNGIVLVQLNSQIVYPVQFSWSNRLVLS
ncbi:MAG: hypothetical protein AAFV95_15745 [Bacteroidota bacterium]